MTQGSSCLATAGLRAGIPLGFSNGTQRRQDAKDAVKTGELFCVSAPWQLGVQICSDPSASKKSQRDFVSQPSVATTKEGLRWVANQKLKSTPTGLWPGRDDAGRNPVGVADFWLER